VVSFPSVVFSVVIDRFNDERLQCKEQAPCAAYLSLKNRELQLPQEMPDKRYLEMLDETPSPWLDAMKHCYDTLTASPYLFGSVTQRTELIALPSSPDGQFNRHHEVRMSSGYDARAPVSNGEETGWCAERKLSKIISQAR
jgi:hypothetical protein